MTPSLPWLSLSGILVTVTEVTTAPHLRYALISDAGRHFDLNLWVRKRQAAMDKETGAKLYVQQGPTETLFLFVFYFK